MEPDPLGNSTTRAPRKVKFAPKAPPRRVQKLVVPKTEKIESADDDDAQRQELLRRFNESSVKVKPKVEKKSATQVAFGYGGGSTSIKSYGALGRRIDANRYQSSASEGGGAHASGLRNGKEYEEPWDYYSQYPATLPFRRPYSGNPELLDVEEFGNDSESKTCDENPTKPAVELGLMEEDLEARMFFLQLPPTMPMIKQTPKEEGNATASNTKAPKEAIPSIKVCDLNELPAGSMGKMLVYKSGAIKMKLGDVLYDVSAGLDSSFAQDVAAINTEEKHCCILGEIHKRAIITPDMDFMLDAISDL